MLLAMAPLLKRLSSLTLAPRRDCVVDCSNETMAEFLQYVASSLASFIVAGLLLLFIIAPPPPPPRYLLN